MQVKETKELIVDEFTDYFKDAVGAFVVKYATDVPFQLLEIDTTLYNFMVVNINIERGIIYFSIDQSGFKLLLFKQIFSIEGVKEAAKNLERELKLRIPDKYLIDKGW